MENFDIYRDIAQRTQGDIYIGVVGPVRTGKSTFIKRFMDLMVIPNIENAHMRERARDELPQSGAGRTIMTTEPKFVPNEAVALKVDENIDVKVRLVDCVGYLVDGAIGYEESGNPRMVKTPWYEKEIPFSEAAEIGTRKVITDHSTIGLVVLTDGSVADIDRNRYIQAENRVIEELKALNKPFVIVLNSSKPHQSQTISLKVQLEEKYKVPVVVTDCANMDMAHINEILKNVLFEFPIKEVNFSLPGWMDGLDSSHWLKKDVIELVRKWSGSIRNINDIKRHMDGFNGLEYISEAILDNIQLGNGITNIKMKAKSGLFYSVLEEITGHKIGGDHELLGLIKEFSRAKREYDRVEMALEEVRQTGYGLVPPSLKELELAEPEIFKHGNRFGVKLKANAPSLHIIRADIATEVSPIVGTEKQSEELLKFLLDEFEADPAKIWDTNMFGKSLHDMVKEQLQHKLFTMPDDARGKMQKTLQKIINDGNKGLICIIL